ncbi:MAG: iron-sulfur cluster-binding domain-containing protein [Bacteroidota bacterium]
MYLNLEIKEIVKETDSALSFILRSSDNTKINFLPGQFITIIFDFEGEEIRRSFSISSSIYDLPDLRITIKKSSDGITNNFFNMVKIGDKIKAVPPVGNFTIRNDDSVLSDFIFIGAGSGITPLYSMIKSTLYGNDKSRIILVYGNSDENSIIFKNEIEQLARTFSKRFFVYHILSHPINNWQGIKGRISIQNIKEIISSHKDHLSSSVYYYLCGPEGMMQTAALALKELKVSRDRIHTESYNVCLLDETYEIENIEHEVTIIFRNREYKIKVSPDESILQKALEHGLELPNSCQHGECGTCKAKLLAGTLKLISQTALSEHDIKNGYCLTCVGHPASENVVILYEDNFE